VPEKSSKVLLSNFYYISPKNKKQENKFGLTSLAEDVKSPCYTLADKPMKLNMSLYEMELFYTFVQEVNQIQFYLMTAANF
jgi:hypothetical protein